MRRLLRFFSLMHDAYSQLRSEDRYLAECRHRICYLEDLLCSSQGMGDSLFAPFEIKAEAQSIQHRKDEERIRMEKIRKHFSI